MINRMAMAVSPGVVELTQRKVNSPKGSEVLIRVRSSSICGSDLHIYKGKHPSAPLPVAIGHEFAGDVVAVGDCVQKVKPGDRVTVEPVITCGKCLSCRQGHYGYCDTLSFHYRKGQGALADYFIADEKYVYKLPEYLSYDTAALIEPLAVAVHAVRRAKVSLGDKLAVLGAGPVGILIAALCKQAGAEEVLVVDLAEHRLKVARDFGATRTVNPDSAEEIVREITGGRGLDKTFECVGIEATLIQAMSLLKLGGLATTIGIFEQPKVTIPAALFVAKEITVQGSQGYCWDFDTALERTKVLDLTRLISHIMPLDKIGEAMEVALDPSEKAVKIILHP